MSEKAAVLENIRQDISAIDRQLFELIKRREHLSSQIGEAKRKLDIPDKDFDREKLVFARAIALAEELELPKNFAINLQKLVMELSLSRQERDRIKYGVAKSPLLVTVIGGAGRMGAWLCHFFADSGHSISVVDKKKPDFACHYHSAINDEVLDCDIIVVAAPIRSSAAILDGLGKKSLKRPVIFDVSSVKAPVKEALFKLHQKGLKVTSLHPMFGPAVEVLFGKHIIITSLGNNEADNLAKDLFKSTSLTVLTMSIDEHDKVISYLLSLSHLMNIIFIKSLMQSGYSIEYLSQFSSTTFSNVLEIAKRVFLENPHLYYEIQALNPHNKQSYELLSKSLEDTLNDIANQDEKSFVESMKNGQEYLSKISTAS